MTIARRLGPRLGLVLPPVSLGPSSNKGHVLQCISTVSKSSVKAVFLEIVKSSFVQQLLTLYADLFPLFKQQ